MIPPPVITASALDVPGAIRVVVTPATDPVRIFYAMEPMQTGQASWIGIQGIKNGEVTLYDLPLYAWLNFVAVYADDTTVNSFPSNIARARALPYLPLYSIDLMRYDQKYYVDGRGTVYRMRLEAKLPKNMPAEIFLYKREPFSGEDLTARDVFMSVCKPGDLTRYPKDAPGTGSPYFRLNYVDFMERCPDLAADIYEGVHLDVEELVKTLNSLKNLSVEEDA